MEIFPSTIGAPFPIHVGGLKFSAVIGREYMLKLAEFVEKPFKWLFVIPFRFIQTQIGIG